MAYTTIDDPSAHFHVNLHTGNETNNTDITFDANAGDFQPDWVWFKGRTSSAIDHALFDSSRGTGKHLVSNTTAAENTQGATLKTFNSNGFRVGDDAGDYGVNKNGRTYVTWNWKANGGTTSSNSDGSITTTVQANTTAGFSIVLYTSASGSQTIGHGLGVAPEMYWIKKRNAAGDDWFVYHSALGEGKKLRLSSTSAAESDTNIWQNTAPTTTVASLQNDGGGVNVSSGGTKNYVGYFFNSVKGYSKIGSYTGNGNADGTFVYTGFKPAWLLVKRTSGTENWVLWDNKRDPVNNFYHVLHANANSTEDTSNAGSGGRYVGDFLSNGFKLRNTHDTSNSSSDYIYMAFAEHPFVSSEGTPTTAR